MTMRNALFVILSAFLGSCATSSEPRSHGAAVVGATGGAVGGAAVGYSSAGLLCTIGGPLCALVVIPAAIVGGLIGGVAGSVADRVSAQPVPSDGVPADTSVPPGG
jgi:hypothetical protein